MKLNIEATICLSEDIDPNTLLLAISPENETMPDGLVRTKIVEKKVITTVSGYMTIGRLIYTIDDILKTAILAKNVSETTNN
ncbi:MAG: KEOPS complex subunit Pcc1 [Candidatus Kariarchaeaceae archaeon]|jgi:hypothetical protein